MLFAANVSIILKIRTDALIDTFISHQHSLQDTTATATLRIVSSKSKVRNRTQSKQYMPHHLDASEAPSPKADALRLKDHNHISLCYHWVLSGQ